MLLFEETIHSYYSKSAGNREKLADYFKKKNNFPIFSLTYDMTQQNKFISLKIHPYGQYLCFYILFRQRFVLYEKNRQQMQIAALKNGH